MAYYNGKKVLSVVKTDQAQFPTYEGSYTITANGTYPTAYKALVDNLVVNIEGRGVFEKCFSRITGNTWANLFRAQDSDHPFAKLTYEDLQTFDFSNSQSITNMSAMFYQCMSLITIPFIDTSNVTIMDSMFNSCISLETIPLLNTSKVTNMVSMFAYCYSLKSVPALDASNASFSNMFLNCRALEEIHMFGMKRNFDIHYSTNFTRSALVEILNNLAVVTITRTLTIGSTNLDKLTADDRAIATNKGWTLA